MGVYATKSRGLLKPPFLFMYCLYFLFNTTWTSPSTLSSTFLPFVVSKPQKPMTFNISCSSGVFPSKSAGVIMGRSAKDFFCFTKEVEGIGDCDRRRRGEGDLRRSGERLRRSKDLERDLVLGLRLSLSLSLSLRSSRRLSSRRRGLGDRPILPCKIKRKSH